MAIRSDSTGRGSGKSGPWLLAAAIISALPVSMAGAVVVYDEPGQNTALPPGGQGWQYVGHVQVGGGVLVAPQVVLTAVHLGVVAGSTTFNYNGQSYLIDSLDQIGNSDLELAHLATTTGVQGAPLYTGSSAAAVGPTVNLVGFGGPKGAPLLNGAVQYGWSFTNSVNVPSWGNSVLTCLATDSSGALPYAAFAFTPQAGSSIFSGGDSGGGMFINVNGAWQVLGINYAVDGYYSYALASTTDPNNPPAADIVAAIYDLSAANDGAAQQNQIYTIVPDPNNPGNNIYALASSAAPMHGYSSLVDNDAMFTVGSTGETYADYLAAQIAALQGTIHTISNNGNSTINTNTVVNFTGTGSLTVSAPVNMLSTFIVQNSLTVDGTLAIAATPLAAGPGNRNLNATTSVVGGLTIGGLIAPTGTLNLNNNLLIISNGGAAARDAATANIAYARDGGAWDRPGITSTNAQDAFGATGFDSQTLGVALNSDLPTRYTSFGGQLVSPSDVLIAFTYGGDANLDGTINGNDYFQIDRGFLNHFTGWVNGDFNYDGTVNGNDYFIIDSNFINQSGALAAPEVLAHEAEFGPAYLSSFSAAQLAIVGVPEPGSLALLGAGMIGLLGRRRKTDSQQGPY